MYTHIHNDIHIIYTFLSFPAPKSFLAQAIAQGAEVSAWSSSAHAHGLPAGCGFGAGRGRRIEAIASGWLPSGNNSWEMEKTNRKPTGKMVF